MKITVICIAAFLLIVSIVPVGAVNASRPVVLVFECNKGDGADKALAASATTALCVYLRQTQRVDAIIFDPSSPTVMRAVMDKVLTADQVTSYSSRLERIGVARALSYDYAAGSELSIKDGMVQVKVWLAKSNGGPKDQWETLSQSATNGTGERDYDNSMQSATSSAVLNISRVALQGLPIIAEKLPATGDESAAIGANLIEPPAQPSAAEYVSQADQSLKTGAIAVAIEQYKQAVNTDPANAVLRMKLAEAYARKGMYNEANAELDRAGLFGASADSTTAIKNEIEKIRGGQESVITDNSPTPLKYDTVTTSPETSRVDTDTITSDQPKADTQDDSQPNSQPQSAVEKIREGDKLWRANQLDEAAAAYREAIKLNPADWRAYERLALVDASMSLFTESRKTLEQLAQVQPNPSAEIISNRYELFNKVFEGWFTALFKQYDGDSTDYEKHIITRESYYNSIKGLSIRLESMAKFLDALQIPKDKQPANLHRSLACGLVAQAASSLLDYLETNNADSKSNAETFVAQAKKELEAVVTTTSVKTTTTSRNQ